MKIFRTFSLVMMLLILISLPGQAYSSHPSSETDSLKCSVTSDIKISSSRGYVNFSNTISNQPVCYKLSIPAGTPFLRLDFTSVKGKFNLYRSEKYLSTFTNDTKVNRWFPISGKKSYAIPSPASGTHTLLIEPLTEKGTSFMLTVLLARASTMALNIPEEEGEAYRTGQNVKELALVLEKNESLTLPFEALGPGKITALVFPDPDTILDLRLQTPERPGWNGITGKDVGFFYLLTYQISPGNYRNERHWELTITNQQKRSSISIVLIWPGYSRQATREENTDRLGEDYAHLPMNQANPELCRQMCVDDRRCAAYTYSKPTPGNKAVCHLKHSISQPSPNNACISGVIVVRQMTYEAGVDITGYNVDFTSYYLDRADPGICSADCALNIRCQAFTYEGPNADHAKAQCWLKEGIPEPIQDAALVSGRTTFRTAVLEEKTDRPGGDYTSFELDNPTSPEVCKSYCLEDPKCTAFTFVQPGVQGDKAMCYLKNTIPAARSNSNCISGVLKVRNLTMEYDTDRPRSDYARIVLSKAHPESCRIQCALDPQCVAYAYKKPNMEGQGSPPLCYLKRPVPGTFKDTCCVSGVAK